MAKMAYVTAWPKRLRRYEFTKGVLRIWKKSAKKARRQESRCMARRFMQGEV